MLGDRDRKRILEALVAKRRLNFERKHNNTPCWEWIGAVSDKGYGITRIRADSAHIPKSGIMPVHRLSWLLFNGPHPTLFQLDHMCENRICFNPYHLQLLGPREHAKKSNEQKARKAKE